MDAVVSVHEKMAVVLKDFFLFQNHPNPFNPVTRIQYSLPSNGNVVMQVYDTRGREIATLIDEVKSAGKHEVEFNASNIPSGIYYYRLRMNGYTATNKMIVLK